MKAWHFGSISNCGTTSSARKFSGNVMPSKASLASNCSNKKITESTEIQTPILGSLLQIQIAEYPLCLLCSSQLGSLDRCQRLQCRCERAPGRIPFRCNPSNRSWQPAASEISHQTKEDLREESSWNLGMTSNWLAQLSNPIKSLERCLERKSTCYQNNSSAWGPNCSVQKWPVATVPGDIYKRNLPSANAASTLSGNFGVLGSSKVTLHFSTSHKNHLVSFGAFNYLHCYLVQ